MDKGLQGSEIATELTPFLTGPMTEPLNQFNPLIILAQADELVGEYDKAIAATNRLGEVYGSAQGVSMYVRQRVAELNGKKMRGLNGSNH